MATPSAVKRPSVADCGSAIEAATSTGLQPVPIRYQVRFKFGGALRSGELIAQCVDFRADFIRDWAIDDFAAIGTGLAKQRVDFGLDDADRPRNAELIKLLRGSLDPGFPCLTIADH